MLRTLVYKLFLKIFYEKKKNKYLLFIFYIKNCIKIFLKLWITDKISDNWVRNLKFNPPLIPKTD